MDANGLHLYLGRFRKKFAFKAQNSTSSQKERRIQQFRDGIEEIHAVAGKQEAVRIELAYQGIQIFALIVYISWLHCYFVEWAKGLLWRDQSLIINGNWCMQAERRLRNFVSLRDKWLERFCGDHKNSVCQQLYDLTWHLIVFHTINESRPLSKNANGQIQSNSMLHGLIDRSFFEYFLISLRRLLDKDRHEETCSLYRLISDLKCNCHLLTRQVYFNAFGQEYDVAKVKAKYETFARQQKPNMSYTVPPSLMWECLEARHSDFDRLSSTDKEKRSPSDRIQTSIFEKILATLDSYEDVVGHANNFVAHLCRPNRQKTLSIQVVDPMFGRLCEAHATLCKVSTFVGKYFLDFGGPFIAVPQFNQFENIDQPFVQPEHINKLNIIWEKHAKVYNSWSYISMDDFETELLKQEFCMNRKD